MGVQLSGGVRLMMASSVASMALSLSTRSGRKIPSVGYGCWKVDRASAADLVEKAIRLGYRHIDGACDYGNEKEVGLGIRRAIEGGVCKREDLFVTSKLWNTFHAPEHVEAACRRSLDDLGLDYLDLYLIHFPISLAFVPFSERYPPEWVAPGADGMKFAKVPVSSTWAAMEKLVAAGMVKDIGVSNWSSQGLRDLLSYCKIRPAVLQVEVHPFLQCRRLVDLAKSECIQVTAFSPLGNGQSYHMVGYQDVSALKEAAVTDIATKLGVTPAQVVLRWGLQRGYSVIPKSENLGRMETNLAVEGFSLSEEDMAAVNSLEKGFRFNDPGHFCPLAFATQCPIWD